MKKPNPIRPLKLNSETIRTLSATKLIHVIGGDDTATRNVCSKECRTVNI